MTPLNRMHRHKIVLMQRDEIYKIIPLHRCYQLRFNMITWKSTEIGSAPVRECVQFNVYFRPKENMQAARG